MPFSNIEFVARLHSNCLLVLVCCLEVDVSSVFSSSPLSVQPQSNQVEMFVDNLYTFSCHKSRSFMRVISCPITVSGLPLTSPVTFVALILLNIRNSLYTNETIHQLIHLPSCSDLFSRGSHVTSSRNQMIYMDCASIATEEERTKLFVSFFKVKVSPSFFRIIGKRDVVGGPRSIAMSHYLVLSLHSRCWLSASQMPFHRNQVNLFDTRDKRKDSSPSLSTQQQKKSKVDARETKEQQVPSEKPKPFALWSTPMPISAEYDYDHKVAIKRKDGEEFNQPLVFQSGADAMKWCIDPLL
ncbi:hypothetical protein DFA_08168 [Cavenderia fasciculata]|uniref:Uncharacterized protein n=1 Tax=Cavenderia fasciculata TaxID=261658 RepID=F4Q5C4_CACFS|nr:uncharacterized protein DFA_08168 [Cavenderia fasciculata]EGG17183.1 hypothetical protein DFA_08168 [Cavenderia fasciculata]|eukprot:XP_004355667.1 hypothetical protein DFA_08168 [Cavenderia fasciculata]